MYNPGTTHQSKKVYTGGDNELVVEDDERAHPMGT
jgi:hypothetical protein